MSHPRSFQKILLKGQHPFADVPQPPAGVWLDRNGVLPLVASQVINLFQQGGPLIANLPMA